MAHKIGRVHAPRRGSLQYWPRKRAKRIYPRIRNWKGEGVEGFAAYKAGMTHIIAIDNRKTSPTKGEKVMFPVTVLEAPPLTFAGVRFLKKEYTSFKTMGEIWAEGKDKKLGRKIVTSKKPKSKKPVSAPKKWEDFSDAEKIKIIAHTNPSFKKTPEIFEIGFSGTIEEAKELLGKQIKIADVLKAGESIDAIAITKGKGFQGPVKRFGITRLHHKSKKTRRKAGSTSPWHPAKQTFRVVFPGQMGFHQRTESSKWILKIGEGQEVNPKGGFVNYGTIKGDYVLVAGSLPGPKKRLIVLRKTIRPVKLPTVPPEIKHISVASKQGN